jgi:hypothetical protein
MAFSGGTAFEVRNVADYTGASDTNGGGFVAGAAGTDWSYASIPATGAAKYALSNGSATTGNATVNTVSASADMVGNIAYVAGGTGSIVGGWYQIVSQVTGTSITLDRSTGLVTGTGVTINIGGCLATPGLAASLLTSTDTRAWVKYSTSVYGITTTTVGSNGPVNLPTNVASAIEGYDQARGDRTGNRPIFQWQTAPGALTYACKGIGGARQFVANLKVDGNSQANAGGFDISVARVSSIDCVATNCNQAGAIGFNSAATPVTRCQAASCTVGFSGAGYFTDCDATACTTGYTTGAPICVNCLARGCTNGFSIVASGAYLHRCTADGNTTAGFVTAGASTTTFISCLSTNQSGGGGIGFSLGTAWAQTLTNCAVYNNTTHLTGSPLVSEGPFGLAASPWITALSADPYVNRAGADFRPNNNNPGGAQLRNAGIGCYGQADNADIGAIQHSDPTGGGVAAPIVGGSLIVGGISQR